MSTTDGQSPSIEERLKSLEQRVEQITPDSVASAVKDKVATEFKLEDKFSALQENIQKAWEGKIDGSANALLAALVEKKEKDSITQLEGRLSQLEGVNEGGTLASRVKALETKAEKPSASKYIELAELPFKTVLDADYHLDDKASRILSAMAFLTAAAAAIFAKAYSPSPPADYERKIEAALSSRVDSAVLAGATTSVVQSLRPSSAYIFGVDLSLFTFLCFMFFILTGVALYLAALGPALNKPSSWVASGTSNITSRLFYDFIARLDRKKWKEHWLGEEKTKVGKKKPEDLEEELESDYVTESHLLAEKARGKYLWMSLGSVSFRLAILCLAPLVASLFAPNLIAVRAISIVGIALVIGTVIFERLTRPPRPRLRLRSLHHWVIWLIGVEALLIVYLPLVITEASSRALIITALLGGMILSALCSVKSFFHVSRPVGESEEKKEKDKKKNRRLKWLFVPLGVLFLLASLAFWLWPN